MKLIVIFLFLLPSLCYSFNWKRCRNIAWSGNGVGFTVSTSSYFSSTGRCSMVGKLEYDKKVFFAQNLDLLQIDIAQGGGEYLSAYLSLSNRDPEVFSKLLQGNYSLIFDRSLSEQETYRRVESCIHTNGTICA